MNLNIQTCNQLNNVHCCPTQARVGASKQLNGLTPTASNNASISPVLRKDAGVLMGELKRQLAMPTSLTAKPTNGISTGVDNTGAGVIIGAPCNQSTIYHVCSCCGKTLGKPQNNSGKAKTLGKPQNNSVFVILQNYAETNLLWQFIQRIQANEKTVPCRDKTIVAVLTHKPSGQKFHGTNGIKRDVGYCPRNQANDRINMGYDKCKQVCWQEHHAEIAALLSAVRHVPNLPLNQCVIDVYGTYQVCNNCQMVLGKHGVYINGVYPNLEEINHG